MVISNKSTGLLSCLTVCSMSNTRCLVTALHRAFSSSFMPYRVNMGTVHFLAFPSFISYNSDYSLSLNKSFAFLVKIPITQPMVHSLNA